MVDSHLLLRYLSDKVSIHKKIVYFFSCIAVRHVRLYGHDKDAKRAGKPEADRQTGQGACNRNGALQRGYKPQSNANADSRVDNISTAKISQAWRASSERIMSAIQITEDRICELARLEIASLLLKLEPVIRAEIFKTCQLVDEKRGIELLAISGKQPQRTFRRLMNKHKVEKVHIGGLHGWKLSSIEQLLNKFSINKPIGNDSNSNFSSRQVSDRMTQIRNGTLE